MPGNALFRYSLSVLVILPIGFLLLYPQLVRCFEIGWSAKARLLVGTGNVYVYHSATSHQHRELRQHLLTAHQRIRQFWGDQRGRAILIYCPYQADYEQYCAGAGSRRGTATFGEGAGCSLGTPWGASYVVLGPEGNNTDVIAHELCHDELFARLGWWRVKRQIPQWFNEGLALMVDYRFSSPTAWNQPDTVSQNTLAWPENNSMHWPSRPMLKLSELETMREFFGRDYTHTMLAYQTAADEVTRWLAVVGRANVPALTEAIANGNDFNEAYRQLESKRRKNSQ